MSYIILGHRIPILFNAQYLGPSEWRPLGESAKLVRAAKLAEAGPGDEATRSRDSSLQGRRRHSARLSQEIEVVASRGPPEAPEVEVLSAAQGAETGAPCAGDRNVASQATASSSLSDRATTSASAGDESSAAAAAPPALGELGTPDACLPSTADAENRDGQAASASTINGDEAASASKPRQPPSPESARTPLETSSVEESSSVTDDDFAPPTGTAGVAKRQGTSCVYGMRFASCVHSAGAVWHSLPVC